MLKKYFKDAFWIGLTNVAMQLKGLILIPLLSKKFGAIGYGAWAQVGVLVGLLTPLVAIGIDQGYNRFMPKHSRQEQAIALWNQIWLHLATSLICFVILLAIAQPMAEFLVDNSNEYRLIYACAAVIAANILIKDVQAFYRAGQNVRLLNTTILIRGFGNLVAVFAAYLLGGGVLEIVLAGAFFDLALALTFLAAISIQYPVSFPDKKLTTQFFSFGWVLIPTAYTMWVINASDRLILAHYGTIEDIGVYSAMYALGYGLIPLVVRPFRAMYPTVAVKLYDENDLKSIQRLFEHSTKAVSFFIIAVFFILILYAKNLTTIFSTPEFLYGAYIIPIIFFSYVINIFASYYAVNLTLNSRQYIVTYSLSAACIANIMLNFILIPRFGIFGAAVSTLLSFLLDLSICAYFGNKVIRLRIDFLFTVKCVFVSAAVVLIFSRIPFAADNLYKIIIAIICIMCLYVLGCFCLKAFSRDDVKSVIHSVIG